MHIQTLDLVLTLDARLHSGDRSQRRLDQPDHRPWDGRRLKCRQQVQFKNISAPIQTPILLGVLVEPDCANDERSCRSSVIRHSKGDDYRWKSSYFVLIWFKGSWVHLQKSEPWHRALSVVDVALGNSRAPSEKQENSGRCWMRVDCGLAVR